MAPQRDPRHDRADADVTSDVAPSKDARSIDDPTRLAEEAAAQVAENAKALRAADVPIAAEPPTVYRAE